MIAPRRPMSVIDGVKSAVKLLNSQTRPSCSTIRPIQCQMRFNKQCRSWTRHPGIKGKYASVLGNPGMPTTRCERQGAIHRNPLGLQGNTLSSCTERRSMKRFAGSSDCHDAVLNRYTSPNKQNRQAQETRKRGSNQATNPARLQDGSGAASEIRAARFCVNHRHTLPLCAEECG